MYSEAVTDSNLIKILIVDDEEIVLSILKQQLQPDGFQLTTANSPNKALEILGRESFSVILADHEMAGMSGLDLLSKVRDSHPSAIRLLMTSTLNLKDLIDAVKSDLIHRFIAKPWLKDELLAILRNSVACQLSSTPIESDERAPATPAGTSETASSAGSEGEMTPAEGEVAVDAYVKMLGAFHPNLGNTAARTRALCKTVAGILDLPQEQARSLTWAGALHDIGLINIDRGIVRRWLRSPDKCNEDELIQIRRHTQDSQQMLADLPLFKEAADIIRGHHENWDGSGYPDRMKGETIPWLSRVLAVAVYFCGKHQPAVQVMNEVQTLSDKAFEPHAVEVVGRAVPLTQMPPGVREILLIELQPGMTLAKDIHNTNGMLILAKGRELTSAWINKIMSINNATPLDQYALIFC